jgi:flagellar hook-basal body protein
MSPGMKLQGWMASLDPMTGNMSINTSTEPIGDLQIKTGQVIPAKATTALTLNGNLNSENKIALEPVVVEWTTGNPIAPTNSKVRMEFEKAHPTLPYYIWSAKWEENPPAGFKVGDAVINENTGEAATGIFEVDEYGKVVNNFINTNQDWVVNASDPIMSQRNTGSIDLTEVFVRNQEDATNALWEINFDQQPDGSFDKDRYYVKVSFDNGENWHSVNNVTDGFGNYLTDEEGNGLGDVTKTTTFTYVNNSGSGNQMAAQVTVPAYMWSGEAARGDIISFTTQKSDNTSAYTQVLNLPNEKPKTENVWGSYTASKPTAAGTNAYSSGTLSRVIANNGMIASNFSSNLAVQDSVDVFSDLPGAPDSGDRVRVDSAEGANSAGLYIYDGTDWNLITEQKPYSIGSDVEQYFQIDSTVPPNGQFRVQFPSNPPSDDTFYVYDGNNRLVGMSSIDEDFYGNGLYISKEAWKPENLTAGTIKAGDSWTFSASQADDHPSSYVINFKDNTTYEIYKINLDNGNLAIHPDEIHKGNIDSLITQVDETVSTYADLPAGPADGYKVRVQNDAGSDPAGVYVYDSATTSWSIEKEYLVLVDDDASITSDFAAVPRYDDPISIPWTNWQGTFEEGDIFTFNTHETRSSETGNRDFFRVQDAGGNVTEIFIPSGSITGADSISFEANTTETTTAGTDPYFGTSNARALSGNPATATFNNKADYQYVTTVKVYDSLGEAHDLQITFEKKSQNLWMWSVMDPDPIDENDVKLAGYGLLAFKEDGSYDPANSITFDSEVGLNNADARGTIAHKGIYFDPPVWGGAPLPGEGAGPVMIMPDFSDLVQFASYNDGEVYNQNGYSKGTLTEYAVNSYGVISGFYDNGYALDIGQIALANFNNPNGLMTEGGSLFRTTSNSGMARVGTAATAGRGTMLAGNLEQSNVELSEEFTNMIVTQRGFQANSRTITTADQMLQELLQLKR